tara:strand:- start:531 stop:875 length:345 start_codon:yes stop_codon:yes gene_type:complete
MSISRDAWISINLNELVKTRSELLDGELSEEDIDELASNLRITLTFDTIFGMVDDAILDYLDRPNPNKPHYGEIQPEPGREAWLNEIEKNRKQFEMVDLVAPAWTIKVPRRKNK